MRIAILGATSQIAKDFLYFIKDQNEYEATLFARRPEAVLYWLESLNLMRRYAVEDFRAFSKSLHFDLLINFIGVGDPARALKIGPAIFNITLEYDQMALNYVRLNKKCRYIFLSSGAVYGGNFESPIDDQSTSVFPINHLGAQNWYGITKMYAEAQHRALANLPIVDLRIFNYFSHTTNIESRSLLADILRSIRDRKIFLTSRKNILRDYIGPNEVAQIIKNISNVSNKNIAIDCYSKAPVDKITILEQMRLDFDLKYKFVEKPTGLTATGNKINYYSTSRRALDLFNYSPEATSLDVVIEQSRRLLSESPRVL